MQVTEPQPSATPKVVAVVADLIFRTRIIRTAESAGLDILAMSSPDQLPEDPELEVPRLVIIDLDTTRGAAEDAVIAIRNRYPAAHLVAYGPHVDKVLLHAAQQAGADQVLARSALNARLPSLLAAHA